MENVRYKHVELALQWMHLVPDEGLPAFRARLRHFRNLGVPDLPKTGSGKQIAYSSDHIYQLTIALALAEFDIAPASIATVIRSQWGILGRFARIARHPNARRQYLTFSPMFLKETWPETIASGLRLVDHSSMCADFVPMAIDANWSPECPVGPGLVLIHLSATIRKIDHYIEVARDQG